jgi:hypothetical protein
MFPKPQRVQARTFDSVQRDLTNTTPVNQSISNSHFLNCRYDPFGKTPSKSYIPDGKGRNVVVRDIKFAHNIIVAEKESLNVEISPVLPFPVAFANDNFMAPNVTSGCFVDGVPLSGVTTGGPNVVDAAYLRCVFPNALKTDLAYTSLGEGSQVMSGRITTIGYRLFYTGPVSNAQGVIIATDHNWSIDSRAPTNPFALNQYVANSPPTAANVDTINAGTSPLYTLGTMQMSNTQNVTSQTVVRPENGLRGVLKYQLPADSHDFVPWVENGFLTGRPNPGGTGGDANIYVRNSVAFPGATGANNIRQFMADPALMMCQLKITGMGNYRLEIAICYEQDIGLNSSIIDMARQSPMIDRAVLDVDSTLNSTVHPAGLNESIVNMSETMRGLTIGRQRTAMVSGSKTGGSGKRARRNRRRRRVRPARSQRKRKNRPCV